MVSKIPYLHGFGSAVNPNSEKVKALESIGKFVNGNVKMTTVGN